MCCYWYFVLSFSLAWLAFLTHLALCISETSWWGAVPGRWGVWCSAVPSSLPAVCRHTQAKQYYKYTCWCTPRWGAFIILAISISFIYLCWFFEWNGVSASLCICSSGICSFQFKKMSQRVLSSCPVTEHVGCAPVFCRQPERGVRWVSTEREEEISSQSSFLKSLYLIDTHHLGNIPPVQRPAGLMLEPEALNCMFLKTVVGPLGLL